MQIIYIHGLNSDHTAEKGKILDEYCQQHHPQIKVHRPNLNMSPAKVEALLKDLIAQDEQTGLVGSSLGGYFATLLANQTGKKAVLLNPFKPSIANISISSTPLFFSSFNSVNQYLEVSFSPIQIPSISFLPSRVIPSII